MYKDVTNRYYLTSDIYYVVRLNEDTGYFRWVWVEPREDDDYAEEDFDTISDALRDAARDWTENGGISDNITMRLRVAATKLERM